MQANFKLAVNPPKLRSCRGAPRAESLRHGQELNALFPRYVQLADVASP